ncbi:hypothetical protein [Mycoplasma ovis]|uniref:hypothetical protein n=1 Tax=Mycoplasma ovis TaxID=171632 RepID=UPI000425010E|nr:hypothetical protein [Mycoplasma ovis]
MSEKDLRDRNWTYGELIKNPKLSAVRLLGNVEATIFNYWKHIAWPEADKVKNLKEKKIAIAVLSLILGEEIGFDCEKGNGGDKTIFFSECSSTINGGKVKRVLKSTWQNSSGQYWVPLKNHCAAWNFHRPLRDRSKKQ